MARCHRGHLSSHATLATARPTLKAWVESRAASTRMAEDGDGGSRLDGAVPGCALWLDCG